MKLLLMAIGGPLMILVFSVAGALSSRPVEPSHSPGVKGGSVAVESPAPTAFPAPPPTPQRGGLSVQSQQVYD